MKTCSESLLRTPHRFSFRELCDSLHLLELRDKNSLHGVARPRRGIEVVPGSTMCPNYGGGRAHFSSRPVCPFEQQPLLPYETAQSSQLCSFLEL